MKRSIKKLIAFITCLALAIQIIAIPEATPVSAAAVAATDFVYDEYWGISQYNGSSAVVELPSTKASGTTSIYMTDCDVIKSLIIPEGYTGITLFNSKVLESITLPSTAEYVSIWNCNALKSIDIPNAGASISVSNCEKLEKIYTTATPVDNGYYGSLTVFGCDALKSVSIPDGFTQANLESCYKLETVELSCALESLWANNLPALKKMEIPEYVRSLSLVNVPFDGITTKGDRLSVVNGGAYDVLSSALICVDTTKSEIAVEKGTRDIYYLGLSVDTYVTKITLPDTVEYIADNAFAGGFELKSLNIPKSVISIGYGAFANTALEKLSIPASVESLNSDAFADYYGKVELYGTQNGILRSYKDGIYTVYENDYYFGGKYSTLIFYPKKNTSIEFLPECNDIANEVFIGSKIKSLKLPEYLLYAGFSLEQSQVEELTIPASVSYIPAPSGYNYNYGASSPVETAPKLKKLVVSDDNEYYSSYGNCLYTKGMTTLLGIPKGISKVTLHKDCLSAASFAIYAGWGYEGDSAETLEVTFPKDFLTMGEYMLTKAKFYAGTPIARTFDEQYEYYKSWNMDDPTQYEFLDSYKDLFSKIEVPEMLNVKAGKKVKIKEQMRMPYAMFFVSKLGKTNNEVVLKFSSSNKKIAKVNSKTGVVTGVKKGTCTINIKCVSMFNGKKKSMTLKVPVKVK